MKVLTLRPMTQADIALGMRLSTIAGWNQVEADWEMFLAASAGGSWVALWDGTPAGTITTVAYQRRFGWVGLLLVAPRFRRKGIGTALLDAAIAHASAIGTLRLDATPEGEPLYTKLGFRPEHQVIRMQCLNARQPSEEMRPSQNLPARALLVSPDIITYDAPVFGAERGTILYALQRRAPQYATIINARNGIAGYCLGRSGSHSEQIGPIVADELPVARALLQAALAQCPDRPVIVDTFAQQHEWIHLLESMGFAQQRTQARMVLGEHRYPGQPEKQFATAGPEVG